MEEEPPPHPPPPDAENVTEGSKSEQRLSSVSCKKAKNDHVVEPPEMEVETLTQTQREIDLSQSQKEMPVETKSTDNSGHQKQVKPQISYRDIVSNRSNADVYFDELDIISEDEEEENPSEANGSPFDLNQNPEEEDPQAPNVSFKPKLIKLARQRWEKSLIVKLLGRNIGYKALAARAKLMWSLQADFEIVDLEGGYFIIKFDSMVDYNHVLTGGPWIVMNHYLTVRKWEPNFYPEDAKPATTAIWIRLPGIPAEYYHTSILIEIAKKFGKPLKTDVTTASSSRGRYARVCVEIDLEKPLLAAYHIYGKKRRAEYEFLHSLCYNCGKIGHRKEFCRESGSYGQAAVPNNNGLTEKTVNVLSPSPLPGRGEGHKTGINGINGAGVSGEVVMTEIQTDEKDPNMSFGPWMLAQPRFRRKTNQFQGNLASPKNSSYHNRFNSLAQHQSEGEKDTYKRKINKEPTTKNNGKSPMQYSYPPQSSFQVNPKLPINSTDNFHSFVQENQGTETTEITGIDVDNTLQRQATQQTFNYISTTTAETSKGSKASAKGMEIDEDTVMMKDVTQKLKGKFTQDNAPLQKGGAQETQLCTLMPEIPISSETPTPPSPPDNLPTAVPMPAITTLSSPNHLIYSPPPPSLNSLPPPSLPKPPDIVKDGNKNKNNQSRRELYMVVAGSGGRGNKCDSGSVEHKTDKVKARGGRTGVASSKATQYSDGANSGDKGLLETS